ncbi:MAG: IS1634 family transposase, partial [Verrucomicrobiales bacterium]
DLLAQEASKETVHARYKSLGEVEQAFRRSKTVELEMRPVHVRKDSSTRGHLLVVMLAYLIMKELGERWAHLDITVKEGLDRLNTYCAVEIAGVIKVMLQPRADVQSLITAAKVTLPTSLPGPKSKVATRKKLPKNRPIRVK